MVHFEDLGGPQGSLGALGGVLGGSWELQLAFGGFGRVPKNRAPHLEAPGRGLGPSRPQDKTLKIQTPRPKTIDIQILIVLTVLTPLHTCTQPAFSVVSEPCRTPYT